MDSRTYKRDETFSMERSYFDGGLLQYIGWNILGAILIFISFGILAPWAVCMIYNWEIKHTVIEEHRLGFDGTAMQLFAHWIKWWLLTVITLGIYGFWVGIRIRQWKAKHTYFVD